uniref:Outer dense fiber protein 4 n=1 Tax=Castor canadensis TaxID=51338 RepID=A0A8C0W4F7_CASCN
MTREGGDERVPEGSEGEEDQHLRPGKEGEVTFIFFTLLLFPINLWIFELKRNISIPIGWSYFLGWLVFILYATCGVLCYLNHKNFWSLILSRPSGPVFCCSSFGTVQEFSSRTECKVSSHTSPTQEVILDPQQQDTHLPPVSVHSSHSPKTVG